MVADVMTEGKEIVTHKSFKSSRGTCVPKVAIMLRVRRERIPGDRPPHPVSLYSHVVSPGVAGQVHSLWGQAVIYSREPDQIRFVVPPPLKVAMFSVKLIPPESDNVSTMASARAAIIVCIQVRSCASSPRRRVLLFCTLSHLKFRPLRAHPPFHSPPHTPLSPPSLWFVRVLVKGDPTAGRGPPFNYFVIYIVLR